MQVYAMSSLQEAWVYSMENEAALPETLTSNYSLLYSPLYSKVYTTLNSVQCKLLCPIYYMYAQVERAKRKQIVKF